MTPALVRADKSVEVIIVRIWDNDFWINMLGCFGLYLPMNSICTRGIDTGLKKQI